jgi:hypothetical protein
MVKTQARPLRILVIVWAVSSCLESAISSWLKLLSILPLSSPFWIAWETCFFSPSRSASWRTIGCRSRTTSPF